MILDLQHKLIEIWKFLLEVSEAWPVILFVAMAALFRELMEHSRDDKWSFKGGFLGKLAFRFFNTGNKGKGDAWKNKWKKDERGEPIPCIKSPWYYLGVYKPKYVERFVFSSTFLVWLTDAEHLFQFLGELAIVIALYFAAGTSQVAVAGVFGFMLLGAFKELFLPKVS